MSGCSAVFVGPHAADDSVGEVTFVGPPGLSWVLPSGGPAADVGAGGGVVALLGHAGDIEHGVDAAVAAEVEAVPDR
jgi:hypothetical protein